MSSILAIAAASGALPVRSAPPPPAGVALGDVAAGVVAVWGERAGAGAGLGDEAEQAEASNVATAPIERAARMSVEWK